MWGNELLAEVCALRVLVEFNNPDKRRQPHKSDFSGVRAYQTSHLERLAEGAAAFCRFA